MGNSTPERHGKDGLPIIAFADDGAWESWLAEHHAEQPGVWLKLAKKGSGTPTVTYAEAVATALCLGWIDSQKGSYDSAWWVQRFTPRRAPSVWSQVNRTTIAALVDAGRMRPAGTAAVDVAKRNGRWERANAPQGTASVPDDLRIALDADQRAAAAFEGLNGANRYAILYRVRDAKRPETRVRRIPPSSRCSPAGRRSTRS